LNIHRLDSQCVNPSWISFERRHVCTHTYVHTYILPDEIGCMESLEARCLFMPIQVCLWLPQSALPNQLHRSTLMCFCVEPFAAPALRHARVDTIHTRHGRDIWIIAHDSVDTPVRTDSVTEFSFLRPLTSFAFLSACFSSRASKLPAVTSCQRAHRYASAHLPTRTLPF